MSRLLKALLSALALASVISTDAQAASFNCSLATTPTEGAICANPQLSKLDDQTAGMYFQIIGSSSDPGLVNQVKSSQVQFLATRNACGAAFECIVSAYTTQMMYLRNVKDQLGLQ